MHGENFWQKLKRIRTGLRFCRLLCETAIIMNKGTHFRFLKSNYSKRKTVLMEWVTSCTGLKRVQDCFILIRIASAKELKWRTRKNIIHYSSCILIEPFLKGYRVIQHSQTFLFLHLKTKSFSLENIQINNLL